MTRAPSDQNRSGALPTLYLLSMAVASTVFLCFLPVLHNDFVNWDDIETLTANLNIRGLTATHLRWMFTTLYMGPYQPLTWLSHALVYQWCGLNPLGHHLVNLVLHAANAVLVFFLVAALLEQAVPAAHHPLDLSIAAATAALFFGIHPLRVEVVAWVTERRELLGALFLLCSLLAYVRLQRSAARRQRLAWFLLSIACFALSLLAKAMGMTLPLILLALDVYPFRRFSRAAGNPQRRAWVLVEKVPYAIVGAAAAAVAFAGQSAGPMATLAQHGIGQRLVQAAYGLCFYLGKTVLPTGLSPLYPLPRPFDPTEPKYVLSAIAVCGTTVGLFLLRRRAVWALTAWVCYVVVLLPVLGLAQTGPQIAADRYMYLASTPWAALAAGGIYSLCRNRSTRGARAALALTVAALAVLGTLTFAQAQVWRNSIALWDHALQVDPANNIAHNNRGTARRLNGDLAGARADFEAAVGLSPRYFAARVNRAWARGATGDLDGAIADYTELLQRSPRYAYAYNGRGRARQAKGDLDGAVADYSKAVAFAPAGSERSEFARNLSAARQQQAAHRPTP